MSDYDDSVSHYAAELGVSERQVRRYCRRGLIPSAELTKGHTGRPKWVINDTSPAGIESVRRNLVYQHFEPPTFCEPIDVGQDCDAKRASTRTTVAWRPQNNAPIRDCYSLITTLAHRAALRLHGLVERDITHPPVVFRNNGLICVTAPAHEKKIRAFERTEFRLLYGLTRPKTTKQYRWTCQILIRDQRENDIMQAAERLATVHQTHAISITYASLACVLGTSKSSLYRTYRGLVGKALKRARKRAVSPTLADKRVKERNRHPGLKRETQQQESEGRQPTLAALASDTESAEDDKHDLHSYSLLSRKVPRDLAFEDLCGAIRELNAAGKPMNERNIYLTLRGQGRLAKGEKLSDYFDARYVANAVRAVMDSQEPACHVAKSHCPAA